MAQLQRGPEMQISGVCAGIGNWLGMPVGLVRLIAVVAFLSFPMGFLIGYAVLARALPEAGDVAPVDLDWEADAVRVGWSGPIAPHSLSWPRSIVAAIGSAVVLVASGLGLGAVFAVIDLLSGGDGAMGFVVAYLLSIFAPFAPFAVLLFLAVLQREYGVRITHDRVAVKRPLRGLREIQLHEVVALEENSRGLRLRLEDGERIGFPMPPDPAVLPMLQEELDRGRTRALAHQEDLEAVEGERRRLERVARVTDR